MCVYNCVCIYSMCIYCVCIYEQMLNRDKEEETCRWTTCFFFFLIMNNKADTAWSSVKQIDMKMAVIITFRSKQHTLWL